MRLNFLAGTAVVLALGWCSPAGSSPSGPPPDDWKNFASLDDSAVVFGDALTAITAKASSDLLGVSMDRAEFTRKIRGMAWRVRALAANGDGSARSQAEALQKAVFEEAGLVPDQDFLARAEPQTAVLNSVLEHRRGV